jgi:SAM-dependent methyltransferase
MDRLLEATARAERDHFWFRGFRRFVEPFIADAAAGAAHGRRIEILDCGCGTGNNLTLLRRYGRAAGIDLAWAGLRYAHAVGERRLARATAARLPFPAETFDLVTSFDVLYALEDPDERAAIAEMFRLLKPGGFAIVNVAAMNILRGDHSVLGHEVRRYTRRQLRTHLQEAGFSIVRLTYTNATLFVPLAVTRLWQRRRGLRAEADAQHDLSVPPWPINTVMTGIVRLETLWVRWFDVPFGSSLLCMARKPLARTSGDSRPAQLTPEDS